jgi:hypothetical protein
VHKGRGRSVVNRSVRVIDRLLAGFAAPDDAPNGAEREGKGDHQLRHDGADSRIVERDPARVVHPPDAGEDKGQQEEVDDLGRRPKARVQEEREGKGEAHANDHHPEVERPATGDPVVVAHAPDVVEGEDNGGCDEKPNEEKSAKDATDHV